MTTTAAILDRVVTLLSALKYTPLGGSEENLFEAVEKFDITTADKAFGRVLSNQNRVALVVWFGEEFTNIMQGRDQLTRRKTKLRVIVSEKSLGDRQIALFGTTTTPGVLKMKDLVIETVTGPLFAETTNDVAMTPVTAFTALIEETGNQFPGRVIASIDFEGRGGTYTSQLDASFNE